MLVGRKVGWYLGMIFYDKVCLLNLVGAFDILGITRCDKVVLSQNVTGCYYKVLQIWQNVTALRTQDVRKFMLRVNS